MEHAIDHLDGCKNRPNTEVDEQLEGSRKQRKADNSCRQPKNTNFTPNLALIPCSKTKTKLGEQNHLNSQYLCGKTLRKS